MKPRNAIRRSVTWVLVVTLVVSTAGAVYFVANPPSTADPYTEFYVLGPDGDAANYPAELSVGESGTAVVGVSNHERQSMSYAVEMRIGNRTVDDTRVSVDAGDTWEGEMSFTAQKAGDKPLRLLLYQENATDPYRNARLWITVSE